ncbi:molybdopterin molybdotransferase MoeA [Diaphorobacter aerolatus]|uniref:Molybdopterin molybdenumtransferase n=1 Tax=Diaphorobacter aerolatus TaxID=1288495 RepID=A0A7H0GQ79_9BURK|nr:gephyrin-like molybdotransferase Glp [Diaphorobacter aerolatus]QNP50445.1 molybdopterin molybdotransferase MoeA [Diaphorobacter aerolatus]
MSLDDALAAVLPVATRLDAPDTVDTFDADGRVLWADAVSDLQVPPLDNSAMDGYAVRGADVQQAGVVLPVSQRIAAGQVGTALAAQTAARIFTGAPVPEGADAIVMQEDTETVDGGAVRINVVPRPAQWVRRAGEDIARGATILAAGTRLTPAALGLAASIGLGRLQVARRPRVALFSTGDELVMPGDVAPADMPPGSIYNSNRFFLRALLVRLGCEVHDCGIVPDDRDATLRVMSEAAANSDLILSSAGVSVGEEDHVRPAVEQLGELGLWKIAMKPGKPFAFGKVHRGGDGRGSAYFMGLPGNPVSSFTTFLMLVRPFILRLQGVQDVAPRALNATAGFEINKPDARREFLRVRQTPQGTLELFRNQSSGVLTSAVWGDGLVDNPAMTMIKKGDAVRYIPFSELLQ